MPNDLVLFLLEVPNRGEAAEKTRDLEHDRTDGPLSKGLGELVVDRHAQLAGRHRLRAVRALAGARLGVDEFIRRLETTRDVTDRCRQIIEREHHARDGGASMRRVQPRRPR